MMKQYIVTCIYLIGLVILPLSGLCELNWLYFVSVILGGLGLSFNILKDIQQRKQQ